MSYQKASCLALVISVAVTLLVGLPRWIVWQIIKLARWMKRRVRLE